LVLLVAVALALSVMVVLWSTLPVQAQSESIVEGTDDDAQPTGKHLIAFSDNQLPNNYAERIADVGGSVETDLPEIGVVVASDLTDEAAERLGSDEDVEVVEQDVELQWDEPTDQASAQVAAVEESSAEEPPAEAAAEKLPTPAFFYPRQWNMRQINAPQAWTAGRRGSDQVTVAILDTGIDAGRNRNGASQHLDVKPLVDREHSVSFVPSDDKLVKANFPNAPEWTDLNYHGTHVAATVSSDAVAAAGVTSKVKLMAVKVLNRNRVGATSNILEGVMHAADNGADVINMSLSGSFTKKPNDSDPAPPGFVSTINRAINYANDKGAVIVVSAGNESRNLKAGSNEYQAYCQSPHVVCVSATGPTSQPKVDGPWENIDALAPYSNYGTPITVAAPGGNGLSTVWAACSRTSLEFPVCQTGTFVISANGTSMAAPHVSGLAALLVGEIGKGRPSEVAAQIRKSADKVGDRRSDVRYGDGRINVAKALGVEES
jgi:subtilisin family serine protease